ncbi:MAG: hypothetical protein LBC18_07760 [Opitutaceae bacterium]|nr:hypothetical protein [Opitutaceae bacterium]
MPPPMREKKRGKNKGRFEKIHFLNRRKQGNEGKNKEDSEWEPLKIQFSTAKTAKRREI